MQKKEVVFQLMSLVLLLGYGCNTASTSVPTVDAASISTSVVETVLAGSSGTATKNAQNSSMTLSPTITSTPTMTPIPTLTATPTPAPRIIFEDNFDMKSGQWYEGELRDFYNMEIKARTEYISGQYAFVSGDNLRYFAPYVMSSFVVSDAVFSIDATITENEKDSSIFLSWRAKNVRNGIWTGYCLSVSPGDRTFSVYKIVVVGTESGNNYEGTSISYDRETVTLSNTFKDISLNRSGKANHFDIAFKGNSTKIFMNSKLVLAITDSEFAEGLIAFGTNSTFPTTVLFDNLKIYDYDTWMIPYEGLIPIYEE